MIGEAKCRCTRCGFDDYWARQDQFAHLPPCEFCGGVVEPMTHTDPAQMSLFAAIAPPDPRENRAGASI